MLVKLQGSGIPVLLQITNTLNSSIIYKKGYLSVNGKVPLFSLCTTNLLING